MSGLKLGVGGGLRLGGVPATAQPATIAQTAYGQEVSPNASAMSGVQPWHLGVAVPIAAVAWLAFLRWSLPR